MLLFVCFFSCGDLSSHTIADLKSLLLFKQGTKRKDFSVCSYSASVSDTIRGLRIGLLFMFCDSMVEEHRRSCQVLLSRFSLALAWPSGILFQYRYTWSFVWHQKRRLKWSKITNETQTKIRVLH